MVPSVVRLLWRALALVCVALGFVGMFLPVVPTVPVPAGGGLGRQQGLAGA